jgi:site-specific DNA-methyltransferase (adenine-specific)
MCRDNKFDLAIVDPPYGIGDFNIKTRLDKKGNRIKSKSLPVTWNNKIPEKIYFKDLLRISKNQIIWGANYYNCFSKGGALIWHKGKRQEMFSQCEIASLSFQQKVDYILIEWQSGFMRKIYERKYQAIHPCQKPIALYKWLLKNYAKPGDRIFDSHVGSGSSRIACYELGFDFIGCEFDKDYWQAQEERFKFAKAKIDDGFIYDKKDTLFDDINN